MSDMKCPFCQQKLESFFVENRPVFACCNLNCKGYFMNAPKELWQELNTNRIAYQTAMDTLVEMTEELNKTKQALDVAVDILKRIDETRSGVKENLHATNGRTLNEGNGFCWTTIDDIHNAQEQITALIKGGDNE